MAKTTEGSERVANMHARFRGRANQLFREAVELSRLPGVNVALFVFSPSKKRVYSFGHPSLDQVVSDYLLSGFTDRGQQHHDEAPPLEPSNELDAELFRLKQLLKQEKDKRSRLLEAMEDKGPYKDIRNKDLSLEQLETFKSMCENLQAAVQEKMVEVETGGVAALELGHEVEVAPADGTEMEHA